MARQWRHKGTDYSRAVSERLGATGGMTWGLRAEMILLVTLLNWDFSARMIGDGLCVCVCVSLCVYVCVCVCVCVCAVSYTHLTLPTTAEV